MGGLSGIDVTYHAVAMELPPPLQRFGAQLPFRLGLTRHPEGRWEDFWVLDVNRDLPGYAAEDPARPGHLLVPQETLERYRAAHHCAIVHGLITDRLVDRQVEPDPRYHQLRRVFLRAWREELTAATGDTRLARAGIARTLRSLRRGSALEHSALSQGHLGWDTYALQTREKLRWGGTAARCLLQRVGHPERAALLERGYDLFCFALQCMDDALDFREDERAHGTSVPAILRVSPGALVRAMPPLITSAIALSERAGLRRLSRWFGSFLQFAEGLHPDGERPSDAETGRQLAAVAQEVLCP